MSVSDEVPQDLRRRQRWFRGRADRDGRRRSHMAGPATSRGLHRQVGQEGFGQRPDVGVVPEAQTEVTRMEYLERRGGLHRAV